MDTKLILRIGANTLLGVVLIYVWSRFVDLNQIWTVLKSTNLTYLYLFALFAIISTVLRSIRLKILLKQFKLPIKDLIFLNFLSQFLSFVIPIRAGEIAKSIYFTTNFKIPIGKTLVWIMLDRFMDFMSILVLVCLLLVIVPNNLPQTLKYLLLGGLVGFTIATIIILISSSFALKMIDFLSTFFVVKSVKRYFVTFCTDIINGFSVLRRNPLELGGLLIISGVAFVSDGLLWLVVLNSLGISLDFVKVFMANMLWALTFLVPAAPGYLGTSQVSALAIFSGIFGVDPNQISAAAVLTQILTTITLLVLGILSIYFLKFDLSLVWKKLKRQ